MVTRGALTMAVMTVAGKLTSEASQNRAPASLLSSTPVSRRPADLLEVVILTESPLVGWGIRACLTGWKRLNLILCAPTPPELGRVIRAQPELVVLAVTQALPGLCRQLRAAQQRGQVGALACLTASGMSCEEHPGRLMIPQAAATPAAIRALLRRALAEAGHPEAAPPAVEDCLTEREREIGRLVATGFSSQEIGRLLYISLRTVEKHRANMMEKLEVANAAELSLALVTLLWDEMAGVIEWPPQPAFAPPAREVGLPVPRQQVA